MDDAFPVPVVPATMPAFHPTKGWAGQERLQVCAWLAKQLNNHIQNEGWRKAEVSLYDFARFLRMEADGHVYREYLKVVTPEDIDDLRATFLAIADAWKAEPDGAVALQGRAFAEKEARQRAEADA